jgi:hypothetical protein
MVTRKQLVSHWREALERSEAEADRVSPQRSWIKRIYARVFRFLLAVYGSADWRAGGSEGESWVADDDEIADRGQGMELVDLRSDDQGTPPKDADRIRQTLQTLHAAGPDAGSGPNAGGLRADEWIVVASKRDGAAINLCAAALRKSGIRFRRRRLGRDTVVQVQCADREGALMLLDDLRDRAAEPPKKRPVRRSKMYCIWMGAGFGGCIGAMISLDSHQMVAAGAWVVHSPIQVVFDAVCGALAGALFGWLVAYHPWKS